MEDVSVLIARSQAGERDAREVLIEKNLGLVRHIVKRFAGRGHDGGFVPDRRDRAHQGHR